MDERKQQWIDKLMGVAPYQGPARKAYQLYLTQLDHVQLTGLWYDSQTVAVMQRHLNADSNCVDVGCHQGDLLKEMLRLCPHGTHFAFEPIPELYKQLCQTFPGVTVYDIALGESSGETSFQHVTSNPHYSGLKRRKYIRQDETIIEIRVRQDRLDNIIPHNVPIHFLKIDVEGAELGVLRGGVKTIRAHKPVIVFEHGAGSADYYSTSPEQVYYFLVRECGLQISLMERRLRGEAPMTRAEFLEEYHEGINFYFMAHP